jgi:serine/threonine-protein kinase
MAMGDPEAPSNASSGPAPGSVTSSDPLSEGVPVAVGDVIADKYRVDRFLGRGGVGVVVQATHLRLNQRVAIKLLLSTAMPDAAARFLREAQAAVRLKSEHVARVLDVGELPSGAPFMVMEFLEGSDLDDLLRQRGAQPIQDAVHYVLDACEAMAEAHAAGIVHRDLKPANLFLTTTADGGKSVKVLDFGISKDTGMSDASQPGMKLTQTTAVFGSPLYMSPEQMRSARLTDARSDIWSLGVILYELTTGKPPFDAEMYPDLVYKVNIEPPPPPSSLRRDLPAKLEAAILRCLEKDAAKRFPDVGKLAAAIAPFGPPEARATADRIQRVLDSSRASMPPLAQTGSSGGGSTLAKTDASWASSGPRGSRPRTGLLIGALVGAAAIIGAIVFFTRARGPEAADQPIGPAVDSQSAPVNEVAKTPDPTGINVVPGTEAPPQAQTAPPSPQAVAPTATPDLRKTAAPPPTAAPTSAAATTPPATPTAPPTRITGPAETVPAPSQPGGPPPAASQAKKNVLDMEMK